MIISHGLTRCFVFFLDSHAVLQILIMSFQTHRYMPCIQAMSIAVMLDVGRQYLTFFLDP